MLVLQPLEYKDTNDNSFAEVSYFRAHIKGRTFDSLADFNVDFMMKLLTIVRRNQLDIIQISFPFGVVSAKIMTKLMGKTVPIVYDAHNVEGDLKQNLQYSSAGSRISYVEKLATLFNISYVPFIEGLTVKCADHILAVSSEDKARFIKKYGLKKDKIVVVPSGVSIKHTTKTEYVNSYPSSDRANKTLIVFHGLYSYPPNREAIDLITDYIAPTFANDIERETAFVIAGTDVPAFERDNIKSLGFVNDIYSLIQAADIAIVPLRRGGGTRLKILEYMAVGLPIVTTKKGIEGIRAENMKHAIIVDEVNEQFINAISYLLDNEDARKQMGSNARKLAEEYSWDRIGHNLCDFYDRIGQAKA